MFVDEVIIEVKAGNGGDGCTAFRREKYIPMGGPFGGNGGKGADIIFKVDMGLRTLLDLRYNKHIKGHKGSNGLGKNMNGKNAENIIIKVPQGTTVTDLDTGLILADLTHENDEVVVAKGGRGGRGNTAFATPANPAPNFSENGEPGEERRLKVELKLLADVGFVGMPSVGKSTLISKISKAKPKIAEYHFTTLSPNLGVVKLGSDSFVVADLPGLIEGASEGVGLGDRFLKHADRCKVLVHMVNMSKMEGNDPINDYKVIREELSKYSKKLANKKEIIVASKMDMPDSKDNLIEFKKAYPDKDIFEISSITHFGIDDLLNKINETLKTEEEFSYDKDEFEEEVYIKFKKDKPYEITKDGDTWVVTGKEIERLFNMTKFTEEEGVLRFGRILRAMGVEETLEKMGAKPGDDVAINDYLFTYKG